jgi:hypothetical protein
MDIFSDEGVNVRRAPKTKKTLSTLVILLQPQALLVYVGEDDAEESKDSANGDKLAANMAMATDMYKVG